VPIVEDASIQASHLNEPAEDVDIDYDDILLFENNSE